MSRARLAAVLWTLAIAAGSALPGNNAEVAALLASDKVLHLLGYAGLAALWRLGSAASPQRVFGWGLAFGGAIEGMQHVLPIGRSFDPYDLVANGLGLLVGLALEAGWRAWRDRRPVASGA